MERVEHFSPISLEHKAALAKRWKPLCANASLRFAEYSFANAYLFRRQHRYVFVDADPPFVRGEFGSGQYYYIPTVPPEECVELLAGLDVGSVKSLFPIPEEWLPRLKASSSASFDREDSDYLYRSEKLRTLSGGALSSRRNLLYQFESHYSVESKPLALETVPDALKVLEEWQRHSQSPEDETDYFTCRDAFEHFQALGLSGRVAYADAEPVGFIVGELLTPSVALFHLSKTIHRYKGVTPFLYRDFANHLPEGVEWINLEQDLGIPSLRKAKEAYEPDLLLPKYRVAL